MSCIPCRAVTSAIVNLQVANNGTWRDAFQFDPDDTSWDLVGQHFIMEIKANRDDTDVLFTLSTDNGRIVITDDYLRVIQFNAAPDDLADALLPGTYVYDLVMYDNSVPPVRTPLMQGDLCVSNGVTQD